MTFPPEPAAPPPLRRRARLRGPLGVLLLALALLVGALAAARWPEVLRTLKQQLPVNGYFTLGPSMHASRPFCYAQIRNRELRVAPTPQGLETATPVRARAVRFVTRDRRQYSQEWWLFPPVALPNLPPGVVSAQASVRYERYLFARGFRPVYWRDSGKVLAFVAITVRDDTGALWVYAVRTEGWPMPAPGQTRLQQLPMTREDLQGLYFEGRAELEGEGLILRAVPRLRERGYLKGYCPVTRPNGTPAQVAFTVRDANGKVVHRGAAPLEGIPNSPNAPQRLPLPESGVYQVTATLVGPVLGTPPSSTFLVTVTPDGAGTLHAKIVYPTGVPWRR